MPDPVAPAVFLARWLNATGTEEKKTALVLARECPDEVRRIAAAEGVALKA